MTHFIAQITGSIYPKIGTASLSYLTARVVEDVVPFSLDDDDGGGNAFAAAMVTAMSAD